jgi:hypothetical protein
VCYRIENNPEVSVMRQTLQATVTLTVSIAATIAVLAVILPEHPAAGGADHMTSSTIRLAVFDHEAGSQVVPAVEAAACPFLTARATAKACPIVGHTASSACPFLAGRTPSGGSCPYVNGSDDLQQEPRCPRGDGDLPAGPPSGMNDRMELPLLAANRPVSDQEPSELS